MTQTTEQVIALKTYITCFIVCTSCTVAYAIGAKAQLAIKETFSVFTNNTRAFKGQKSETRQAPPAVSGVLAYFTVDTAVDANACLNVFELAILITQDASTIFQEKPWEALTTSSEVKTL